MIVVGLTGGIASGKSFVAGYLKKMNIPTHESDSVITEIYQSSSLKFVNFLLKSGFEKCLLEKKINKEVIRNKFFKNKSFKKKIEGYLHNEVKKKRKIFLNKNKNKQIVFLDIPLLFEMKLEKICDVICCTIAPIKIREKRALQRMGMNKKIFKEICENQVNDAQRRSNSNYLIKTHKTKTETCLQVKNIIYDILSNTKKVKK